MGYTHNGPLFRPNTVIFTFPKNTVALLIRLLQAFDRRMDSQRHKRDEVSVDLAIDAERWNNHVSRNKSIETSNDEPSSSGRF